MKYKALPAITCLAVVGTATPAFANPSLEPLGPMFLPAVLMLVVVYNLLVRLGGAEKVKKELYADKKRPDRSTDAVIVVVVSIFVSIIGYLAMACWCFASGLAMIIWAISAGLYRERPVHLREVGIVRMFLCGALLLLSIPASMYLNLYLMMPFNRIHRDPMARAVSEVRNADLALVKLLADAERKHLRQLFANPAEIDRPTLAETIEHQTKLCYELLRKGKDADLDLKPELRQKLGNAYMDIGKDPWGTAYQFYLGPLKCRVNEVPFRSYRGEKYIYDRAAFDEAEKRLRNNPEPDADIPPAPGYPAPRDLPFYMFSYGQNRKPEQLPWNGDGGDDINNWDNETGWSKFYY